MMSSIEAPSLVSHKTPRFATMLFQQLHIGDGHAPVHGFAHVVNGEQGDWGSHTNQQLSAHGISSLGLILCI
jgi:hypothetical protein